MLYRSDFKSIVQGIENVKLFPMPLKLCKILLMHMYKRVIYLYTCYTTHKPQLSHQD